MSVQWKSRGNMIANILAVKIGISSNIEVKDDVSNLPSSSAQVLNEE